MTALRCNKCGQEFDLATVLDATVNGLVGTADELTAAKTRLDLREEDHARQKTRLDEREAAVSQREARFAEGPQGNRFALLEID